WTHIGVIRPSRGVDSISVDALTDIANPRRCDFVLNVAVVPGEALAGAPRNEGAVRRLNADAAAGSKKEPVRIGEGSESWSPHGIGSNHVQGLHANVVRLRNHNIAFHDSGVRVEPAQLA